MIDIQALYIAYYGRAADPTGLTYWTSELEKADGDLSQIINAFGNSEEYQKIFGNVSWEEQIDNLYLQTFARHAGQEGMEYYLWRLDTGLSTLPEIAWDIVAGAQGQDLEVLELRLDVAELFTTTIVQYEITQGVRYSGKDACSTVRGFFTNVIDYKDTVMSGIALFPKVMKGLGYKIMESKNNNGESNIPSVQFNEELYGPIQYEWNSVKNELTVLSRTDANIDTVVVTTNGEVIAQSSSTTKFGEVTLNLQLAYEGGDDTFGEVTGFDDVDKERLAYISNNEYTFTFTDINGDVIEESYFLIINKALNLLEDALSTTRREMILQGERDTGATKGSNSGNRDIWFKANVGDLDPDRIYAESIKDWGNKDQWVTMGNGVYAEGSEDNPLFLSFNSIELNSLRAVMTVPDDLTYESSVSFYGTADDSVPRGTSTVVHYKNIALGGNAAPGVSLLYGNQLNNLL